MREINLDNIMNGVYEEPTHKDKKDNQHQQDRDNRKDKKKPKGDNIAWIYATDTPRGEYDKDGIYKILVRGGGLVKIIRDLKKASSGDRMAAIYVNNAIRSIIFAAALPEAIEKTFGNEDYQLPDDIDRKDIVYLLDELLRFCNNNKITERLINKYGEEHLTSMKAVYIDIILQNQKKKLKKLQKLMSDDSAKKIALITTGRTIDRSIYSLLKYLYQMAEDGSEFNKKTLIKIFKICYGKKSMVDVAKFIMLEDAALVSDDIYDFSSTLDDIWMDTLNELSKPEIIKVLKEYVKTRRRQEGDTPRRPRRLGNRKALHPDDNKKLVRAFESLEERDISVRIWFR